MGRSSPPAARAMPVEPAAPSGRDGILRRVPAPSDDPPYRRRRLIALGGLLAALVAVVLAVAAALGGGSDGDGGDSGSAAPRDAASRTTSSARTTAATTPTPAGPARDMGEPGPARPVPILMYHVISDPPPGARPTPTSTSPATSSPTRWTR